MNIAIIGGGNMGCVLATRFSQNNKVILYVSNKNNELTLYKKNMHLFCEDTSTTMTAKIFSITDSLEDALKNVEYVFVTYPQFLFESLSKKMIPLLQENTHLIFIPGSGGAELWFQDALKKNCTITGLQRVHAVTRIIEKGKSVRESGVRKGGINIASIPSDYNAKAKDVLANLFEMNVNVLPNYLNITLINSNPILHTSRLYSLFQNFDLSTIYTRIPLFYEEWDIDSSKLLIKMDNELAQILQTLTKKGLDCSGIIPLLDHYESSNEIELTNKIRSINSFKGLQTPSVCVENGYIPDLNSRYFISDFPYGLDIILSFAKICNINCFYLDLVSKWYHKLTNTNVVFDLKDYKIMSLKHIVDFYSR